MMRGLPMDFPDDPDVFNIDNQFMFGPSMLVTPVTEEQHFPKSGISNRDVKGFETYLPAGNEWYDFWTGQKLEGNQKHWRPTPLDIMPLYVKAGSIIPMGPFKQYAAEIPEDPIELRIYPGADGNFVLFEDENDNYNYENGIFATIEFLWDEDEKTLKIGERKGVFPGMLKERTFNIILVGENHGVGAEITIQTDKEISYSGQEMVVNF
jgi:alpha-D-xyloside xylohydrolase